MDFLNDTSCCGLKEIDGLRVSATDTVKHVCEDIFNLDVSCAFVLFTDVVGTTKLGRGQKLCKFIREKHLGRVTASPTKINPNTDNPIQVWVWSINRKALEKYFKSVGGVIELEDDEDDGYSDYEGFYRF